MKWDEIKAAIYRAKRDALKAVVELDEVKLSDLKGIEAQKEALLKNTENFVRGRGFHHAMLWGARGTGKSSLIKAVFNAFCEKNLRLIEIEKQDLHAMPEIIDEIRLEKAYKFIIFCDDLSFENGDESYKFLKPLLEGSIEKTPENIALYATSNRRHFLAENVTDNENAEILGGELHLGDAKEEKLSLADRFGLWISFYQGSLAEYLDLVEFYFRKIKIDKKTLHEKAREFAAHRGTHSARTAKQFYLSFKDENFG